MTSGMAKIKTIGDTRWRWRCEETGISYIVCWWEGKWNSHVWKRIGCVYYQEWIMSHHLQHLKKCVHVFPKRYIVECSRLHCSYWPQIGNIQMSTNNRVDGEIVGYSYNRIAYRNYTKLLHKAIWINISNVMLSDGSLIQKWRISLT